MNTSGWAFGSDINNDTESWNGNSIVSLPGALHLNNQDFVIGNGSSGGCRWQSGTSVSIASLLPPSYQNQINGIAPCFLSNQNQNDGTTNIYFNA
jgi:hypothetical protein